MKLTVDELLEICSQAHDQLHKGNTAEAHELLHKALAGERLDRLTLNPLLHRLGFDQAFRTASVKNGAIAMYVLADTQRADGQTRMLTGGDAHLCVWVGSMIRKAAAKP